MRVLSDLFFDLSIHFISCLFISLIFLLLLLPCTFYFLDVVDNKPAHFRWELGTLAEKNSSTGYWAQRPLHHRGVCRVHPGVLKQAAVPLKTSTTMTSPSVKRSLMRAEDEPIDIQTKSRASCPRELRKVRLKKARQWRNRDQWIWCQGTSWAQSM